MSEEILDKDISYEDGQVVITQRTRVKLDIEQLEVELSQVLRQKSRLKEQNIRTIAEYNKLSEDELELKSLINKLGGSDLELEEV